ncbi:DUF1287 domain-containing protein [Flavobacterium sp.]|uniref:DUF1287 domain-containing protein n=1 Tax=Flavobacterium sp. TaxID=239 RepID=UPI0035299938
MKIFSFIFLAVFLLNCKKENKVFVIQKATTHESENIILIESPTNFYQKLSNAAISIIDPDVVYTPSYVSIKYPGGDVPAKTGVCSDVVIRAYRKLGIDLQKEVHEDMKLNFSKYPKTWGMKTTDTNIDHRRVPNLETFFERKGKRLPITQNGNDYQVGDIVSWRLNGNSIPHIGIVTHLKSDDGKRNKIVHNIGSGQVLEDCLFNWKIVGHYRYGN